MKPIAAVLLFSALPVFAATPAPAFADPARRAKLERAFPEIEKIFEQYATGRGIPGFVFGIVIDGELAHVKTYGVRDRKSNDPVTPETVFRIASMTKSFTALALLKLRDEGKLSFDDPVSKWIPEFSDKQYPTTDSAPVRVRQLLTHGVGLPEDNPWGDQQLGVNDATMTAWLKKGLPFSTAPDTEYEYANYGFALAGRVIANVTKRPYREYMEKEILAPLGMKASTLEPTAVPAAVRAQGYRRLPDGSYADEPSLPHGAFGPMGGMLTSAADLAKYVAFMLSAWPPRDGEERGPVRRSSVREMQRVWRTNSFNVDRMGPDGGLRAVSGGYGYGLGVSQDCRFRHMVAHGGGLPGFGSYMWWLPEYGVGVIAMANLTYAGPGGLMPQVAEALRKTGGLETRRLPVAPELTKARDGIMKLWEQWDDKVAASLAASNLFEDMPVKARQDQIERMKKDLGVCRPAGEIEPENLLRGSFGMNCERGTVGVSFTLAPTMPPTVQYLSFQPARNLEPQVKASAEGFAALMGGFSEEKMQALAATSGNFAGQRPVVETASVLYGKCRLGDTVSGDGRTMFRVRLECDKGPVEVGMRTDESGKLTGVLLMKPADVSCVP